VQAPAAHSTKQAVAVVQVKLATQTALDLVEMALP
jgi:hypothetical protein